VGTRLTHHGQRTTTDDFLNEVKLRNWMNTPSMENHPWSSVSSVVEQRNQRLRQTEKGQAD